MKFKTYDDLQQVEMKLSFGKQKMTVSIYLVDGLLVDTGPAKMKSKLIPLFQQWDIKKVILTHHHEDHTGMANWLQETKGIQSFIHNSGIGNCEKEMKLPFYRKIFWGEREPFQPEELPDTFSTPNYNWDVIHTPGHAHDHVALFNREKGWMFGGDLYVQPSPKSMFAFESVPEIIESLKKILTYDFETYMCSHAGVKTQGRKVISDKLDYLVSVQQEVQHLYDSGMSPQAIKKKLYPKSHPMHYLSFFENSPKHIITSILK